MDVLLGEGKLDGMTAAAKLREIDDEVPLLFVTNMAKLVYSEDLRMGVLFVLKPTRSIFGEVYFCTFSVFQICIILLENHYLSPWWLQNGLILCIKKTFKNVCTLRFVTFLPLSYLAFFNLLRIFIPCVLLVIS